MAKTLYFYMKAVQRLIRDSRMVMIDPQDIIDYVNEARREVANRAQCLRIMPLASGAVMSGTVISPGSGYTAPVATITPPDFPQGFGAYPAGAQSTADVTQLGGQIVSVNIDFGGSGYFQPQIFITDPTGTGAEASVAVSPINVAQFGQEVYPFSAVDLSPYPGVDYISSVISVSIIFDNYRFMLPKYSFSEYQSKIRQYPYQYYYVPALCSQFGQGSGGSLYLYPLPSQQYQMEWDCLCVPSDLTDDQSVEALPETWTDCVKFYAAKLAFQELQNFNSARYMEDQFNQQMLVASRSARLSSRINPYGRY